MSFDAKLYRLSSNAPVIPAQTYPACCCFVAVDVRASRKPFLPSAAHSQEAACTRLQWYPLVSAAGAIEHPSSTPVSVLC
jgi:hypothetical protein